MHVLGFWVGNVHFYKINLVIFLNNFSYSAILRRRSTPVRELNFTTLAAAVVVFGTDLVILFKNSWFFRKNRKVCCLISVRITCTISERDASAGRADSDIDKYYSKILTNLLAIRKWLSTRFTTTIIYFISKRRMQLCVCLTYKLFQGDNNVICYME